MATANFITVLFSDVFLGCLSLTTFSWLLVAVQTFINDRKREKREREKAKRDAECHEARMKELLGK